MSVESLLELAKRCTPKSTIKYIRDTRPNELIPILKQAIRNEELLKEAVEMAEFYGNKDNYYSQTTYGADSINREACIVVYDRGQKASDFLKKMKDE